ncbi:kanadaptin-like [Patiria miniata]|uniref:FHA domain-containing protein n=1 Tax=Patiria miniata TaxID=46514 RepID=A0A914BQS8_PATMI|nr:kanadaptin-like [Patiria miniata]
MAATMEDTEKMKTSSADDIENAAPCEAVVPSRVISDDMDEGRDVTKNTEETSGSVSFSADKQDAVGFKLPGLPLPSKTGAQKLHSSAASKALEQRPKNDEPPDNAVPTSQSDEDRFAFPKPQSATNSKPSKNPNISGPPPKEEHSSPCGVQARAPVTTEKKVREKSPAEKLAKAPPLPYKEPSWSGVPQKEYFLDVLKGGAIISKIPLNDKSYHVFGRLETCDIPLEHPSLSRYHLVLQYRLTGDSEHDPGFYLYDLGSTHSSWFNKQQMEGRVFYRIRVGHMFKLGGSSRMYILQGPSEDQEAESELSVKELKELRQQQLAELEEQKSRKQEKEEAEIRQEEEKDAGISWGMDYEDADDADTAGDNPFAIMTQDEKEASYIKDPKKTLRGYFEREGYDLEYNVEEKESGFSKQFVCKVELPIDDASGRPIYAEAAVQGKKKEAVVACALEACRILDAHGVLRQATHESHKRKAKNWKEDDYYDSDEDTFLDRTGEIEKKRMMRMKKACVVKEKAQTYDSLKSQLYEVETEMEKIEKEMTAVSKSSAASVVEDDSLDAFMESIKSGKTLDKTWRARLKLRLIELRKEQARLTRLVEIAKPASMPALQKPSTQTSFAALSKKLPMFGSIKGRACLKPKLKPVVPSRIATPLSSTSQRETDREVEDEEDEDEPEEVVSPSATTSSSKHMGVALPDRPMASSPGTEATSTTDAEHKPSSSGGRLDFPSPSAPKLGPSLSTEIRKQNHQEANSEGKVLTQTAAPMETEWRSPDESKTDLPDERAKRVKTTKKALMEREVEETEDKEDFTDWTPPVGQTGDGRTHLNAKFGY